MVGFLLAGVPYARADGIEYVSVGAWCWLDAAPKYARFVFLYAFVYFVVVSIIVINTIICINFRFHYEFSPSKVAKNRIKNIYKRLVVYPIAFLILWIPSIANRISQAVQPNEIYVLVLLQAIFLPLQGFVDALVYGFTSILYDDFQKCYKRNRDTARSSASSLENIDTTRSNTEVSKTTSSAEQTADPTPISATKKPNSVVVLASSDEKNEDSTDSETLSLESDSDTLSIFGFQ